MFDVIVAAKAKGIRATFLDQRGFLDSHYGGTCSDHPSAEIDLAMGGAASVLISQTLGWSVTGMCYDTPEWTNGYSGCSGSGFTGRDCAPGGYTCAGYETRGWCKGGQVLPGQEWTVGSDYNHPETHCCNCGGGTTPVPSNCGDTVGWTNGYEDCQKNDWGEEYCKAGGWTCEAYAAKGWCRDGVVAPGQEWSVGSDYNHPEVNCCVCGGGMPSNAATAAPALIV